MALSSEPQSNTPPTNQELRGLLSDSLEYSRASYTLLKKMHRWMVFDRIFSTLKFLLILVPLVLGIIYLPPLLQNLMASYSKVTNAINRLP